MALWDWLVNPAKMKMDLRLDCSDIAKQWQHDHKNQEPQKQIIAIKSLYLKSHIKIRND